MDESPIIWSGGSKCKLPPDFVTFFVNYGGPEKQESREFGVGNANANIVPHIIFCHVSKFQTPDCLHYNAVKSFLTHDFQDIFNVHQITISNKIFNIFLTRGYILKYRLEWEAVNTLPKFWGVFVNF